MEVVSGALGSALVEEAPPAAPADPPVERRVEAPSDAFSVPVPLRKKGLEIRALPVRLDPRLPLMPHTEDNCIVEQYRKLRTKLQQENEAKPIHSLLVASPGPGEGKTVTVMNLALSFAMLPDFKVLVIDGDLRKGSVAKWLGLQGVAGLSNVIDGSAKLEEVIFKGEDLHIYFMPAGTSQKPAAELLTSPALGKSIQDLAEHFDLILMDSPPVNLLTDAQMLAASCDAILLVARAFTTSSKALQKTLAELSSHRLVGTVLNGGMRGREYKNYYGY